MRITYNNKKVEKYFTDYNEMKKIIPDTWVRIIKKHVDRLRAAETFGDFLLLNLGHPEPLKGKNNTGKYSLHVTANVRLVIKPDSTSKTIKICQIVKMEGVVDYHGTKETWYIR